MDVNKNSYTFMFSAVMVLVVAALLSFVATTLKPYQDNNVEQEKMQNILSSIGVEVSRAEAAEEYYNYIKEELVVNNNQLIEGVDAFTIDMAKEVKKSRTEINAPLYIAEKEGKPYYILPLRGTGLWGPIWGYVALEEDINTVYGAVFDHKAETPGLGAEIKTETFMNQFKGKKVLDETDVFVSIAVKKGQASGDYEVDGISGGTITSVGVETMLAEGLSLYIPFLKEYVQAEEDDIFIKAKSENSINN